jgi:hypothetical protein
MPLSLLRGHDRVPRACSSSEHDTRHIIFRFLTLLATQLPPQNHKRPCTIKCTPFIRRSVRNYHYKRVLNLLESLPCLRDVHKKPGAFLVKSVKGVARVVNWLLSIRNNNQQVRKGDGTGKRMRLSWCRKHLATNPERINASGGARYGCYL